MTRYLCNAFSLGMIDMPTTDFLRIGKIRAEQIPKDVISIVGHADTARILSGILGFEVPFNRTGIKLTKDDILYVAQYKGPRLPEGTTVLPEGASFEFVVVAPMAHPCLQCCGGNCLDCGFFGFISSIEAASNS